MNKVMFIAMMLLTTGRIDTVPKCKSYNALSAILFFKEQSSFSKDYIDGFIRPVNVTNEQYVNTCKCGSGGDFGNWRTLWYPNKSNMLLLPPPYWEEKNE